MINVTVMKPFPMYSDSLTDEGLIYMYHRYKFRNYLHGFILYSSWSLYLVVGIQQPSTCFGERGEGGGAHCFMIASLVHN